MTTLRLASITKRFGKTVALDDVSIEVGDGEFFCLLGRSGAGKTTTLRTIAGLESPTAGEVYLDGARATPLHPSQRDVAMIFENLALYPDRTGYDNIAFPLRVQRRPEPEIRARVSDVAKVLEIGHILDRYPRTFSGGERQRVAIGRAIIRKPRLYLFDEPLSNLDALLRLTMRAELKRLQRELGQTIIYVTPDQVEAMSMADRIAVLERGRIQQVGPPLEIYQRPANTFVAGFLGSPPMNLLPVDLESRNGGYAARLDAGHGSIDLGAFRPRSGDPARVVLGVRPEDIRVSRTADGLVGTVAAVEPLGGKTILDIAVDRHLVKALAPPDAEFTVEERVVLKFDKTRTHLFDQESGRRIA